MSGDMDSLPQPTPSPQQGELLWTPCEERIRRSNLYRYMRWLEAERGLSFSEYEALWSWSVTDPEAFWASIWDYFGVEAERGYDTIRSGNNMLETRWFEGAILNFTQNLMRFEGDDPEKTVIHAFREGAPPERITWRELGDAVRKLASALRELGIRPGDRVVSYLPNTPQAAIAMLAATAIGAVFASAAPEFGAKTVIDRFGQLEPRLLFAPTGYRYGGKDIERTGQVETIVESLPSLEHLVVIPFGDFRFPDPAGASLHDWQSLFRGPVPERSEFRYEQVPADHPLWVLFSSGTTGLPKAIVHTHAGILLEHLKNQHFSGELGPDSTIFFYTTTSWMVWNSLFCSLLTGASVVLYDGNPLFPDSRKLWQIVEEARATYLGLSPSLVRKMDQDGIRPGTDFDIAPLETVVLGGAPSTPQTYEWFYRQVKQDLWVSSQSGGTDMCTTLISGVALLPVYAGEMQGRALGIQIDCWSPEVRPVRNEVGELVIRAPFPSMPTGFWNDPDGARFRESYFSHFPGIWRQGDMLMINDRGGCFVFGRSDATLNRHGVRIGTAEIYRTLETIEAVQDSLVIGTSMHDHPRLLLFVKMRQGRELTGTVVSTIRARLSADNSPRHVPDEIIAVPAIPYTLTGKRLEVPVRRIIEGADPDKVTNRDLMREPSALDWYVHFAARERTSPGQPAV